MRYLIETETGYCEVDQDYPGAIACPDDNVFFQPLPDGKQIGKGADGLPILIDIEGPIVGQTAINNGIARQQRELNRLADTDPQAALKQLINQ